MFVYILKLGYYHIKTSLHMLFAFLSRCDHEAWPTVSYSHFCASLMPIKLVEMQLV